MFVYFLFVLFFNSIMCMSHHNLMKLDFRKLITVHLTSSQALEAVLNN